MTEPAKTPPRRIETLRQLLQDRLGEQLVSSHLYVNELTAEVKADDLLAVAATLRDGEGLGFDTLVDLSAVDYLQYGVSEWQTDGATSSGFERGVVLDAQSGAVDATRRFGVAYHLLSVQHNQRLRMRVYAPGEPPVIPSVVEIWPGVNWFEREAFDLFGILFEGHPDLRRILTDYGFVGHPFRKDFPLIGNVEVRYDPEQKRVIYQPVSIEPRVLVPKVIREDHRYSDAAAEDAKHG